MPKSDDTLLVVIDYSDGVFSWALAREGHIHAIEVPRAQVDLWAAIDEAACRVQRQLAELDSRIYDRENRDACGEEEV